MQRFRSRVSNNKGLALNAELTLMNPCGPNLTIGASALLDLAPKNIDKVIAAPIGNVSGLTECPEIILGCARAGIVQIGPAANFWNHR